MMGAPVDRFSADNIEVEWTDNDHIKITVVDDDEAEGRHAYFMYVHADEARAIAQGIITVIR